jgi:cell division GTPase FtsZ
MKLIVIGFGQCGGRIADEFGRLNTRARFHRRIDVLVGALAVNTDVADLDCLSSIGTDYRQRVLIGNRRTGGHGVGKVNELGAEVAREDSDKVIDAIRSLERLYEADAFLLIAGAAGGTGSGSMPVMAQAIRERWKDKAVFSLVALPFGHEEQVARTLYNTATCLKAAYSVSDAVFLVDNQRYIEKDSSLENNMVAINRLIAEPFYDLLCAGEEKKASHIGTKLLDAGDIMRTLGGWTVIGYGAAQLPVFRLPIFQQRNHFRNKSTETHKGLTAMNQAMSNLSLSCDLRDSASALYLLSAPSAEMNMGLVKEGTT